MTKSAKAKRSFSRFIGVELILTVVSAIGAILGGQYAYNLLPGLFVAIAALIPPWFQIFFTVTGYGVAVLSVAFVIWLGSNSLLFALNLRKY